MLLKLCQHLLCSAVGFIAVSAFVLASPTVAHAEPADTDVASVVSVESDAQSAIASEQFFEWKGGALLATLLAVMFMGSSIFNIYYLITRKKIWKSHRDKTGDE